MTSPRCPTGHLSIVANHRIIDPRCGTCPNRQLPSVANHRSSDSYCGKQTCPTRHLLNVSQHQNHQTLPNPESLICIVTKPRCPTRHLSYVNGIFIGLGTSVTRNVLDPLIGGYLLESGWRTVNVCDHCLFSRDTKESGIRAGL